MHNDHKRLIDTIEKLFLATKNDHGNTYQLSNDFLASAYYWQNKSTLAGFATSERSLTHLNYSQLLFELRCYLNDEVFRAPCENMQQTPEGHHGEQHKRHKRQNSTPAQLT